MRDPECIFCKIAAGEIEAEIIHDDADIVAFRDIEGRAPEHWLVIPREHVANLEEISDLSPGIAGRLFEVSSEVAGRVGITEGGYAVRINNGPDAGQEIFHLHLHVLGGRKLGMP